MAKPSLGVLVLVACLASTSARAQQDARSHCVTSRDAAWRPTFFGFETENGLARRRGVIVHRDYPILRNIVRGSPADSAGLRDGDQWIAIDGVDLALEHDSARVKGPGIPTRMTIKRGTQRFERTLVGVPMAGCRDSSHQRKPESF